MNIGLFAKTRRGQKRAKPDGYYHGRITVALSPFCFGVGALAGGFATHTLPGFVFGGIFCALGCLFGLYMDPDLDQEMVTSSRWRVIKMELLGIPVGKFIGSIWTMIWFPYALAMPHRSFWSHAPIVGTAGRAAWLLFVCFLSWWAVWGLDQAVYILGTLLERWQGAILMFLAGLAVSDWGHWVRDQTGFEI